MIIVQAVILGFNIICGKLERRIEVELGQFKLYRSQNVLIQS